MPRGDAARRKKQIFAQVTQADKEREKARKERKRQRNIAEGKPQRNHSLSTRINLDGCGAMKSDGETRCKLKKGFGTDHPGTGRCKYHGGNLPTHKKAAAVEEARRLLRSLTGSAPIDPNEALIQAIARSNAKVMFWDEYIVGRSLTLHEEESLPADEAIDPLDPKTAVALNHLAQAEDQLSRIARNSVDLGLKERQVALLEGMSLMIVKVFRASLASLGMSPEQIESAQPHIRQQLMLVASGQEPKAILDAEVEVELVEE